MRTEKARGTQKENNERERSRKLSNIERDLPWITEDKIWKKEINSQYKTQTITNTK